MSIGRRLFNLARAELNSLLERAARSDDEDDRMSGSSSSGIDGMTDAELEAELERRRMRRAFEEAERATRERTRPTPPPPRGNAGHRYEPPRPAGGISEAEAVRRAYVALEIPQGSDFETVRKAYRTLMRKYHPDRHTATPEKQRAANEVAQKLTEAYKLLEKRLRK